MIVYLDSNIVIYAVEQNPILGPKAHSLPGHGPQATP
jgi:hypothetical protein